VVAHGQMPEGELEKAMLAFVEGRADVLVATTIIENGLDIPRANTLIVNRADRYGLAQLYQLRGAWVAPTGAPTPGCWCADKVLSEVARKRLQAIREFSELGAGFRIAALDWSCAGLATCWVANKAATSRPSASTLHEAARADHPGAQGRAAAEGPAVQLNLRVDLRVPEEYVPEVQQRLQLYKRVSRLHDEGEIAELLDEIRDRYGEPPPEIGTLLACARLRLQAAELGLRQVDRTGAALLLHLAAETPVPPAALAAWVTRQAGAALSPRGPAPAPAGRRAAPGAPGRHPGCPAAADRGRGRRSPIIES